MWVGEGSYLINENGISQDICQINGMTKKMRMVICKERNNYPTRNVKILTFRNGFLDIVFLDSSKRHIHLPIFLYHESVLKGNELKRQTEENTQYL